MENQRNIENPRSYHDHRATYTEDPVASEAPVETEGTKRIRTLQGHGLTENQAKAYTALLEMGRSSASALNKASGVPRNKVYSVVEELNEKGLVDIVLEDPITFEPRPLGRYLDMLIADLGAQQEQLQGSKKSLDTEFQLRRLLSEEDLKAGTFRIIKGRRAVVQQNIRMDREAKEHIQLLASPSTPARMIASGALSELDQTQEAKPIEYEIYTPLTKDNISAVETLAEQIGETVRVTYGTQENVGIKMIDDTSVLFTHSIPDSDSVVSGNDVAVWSDSPAFLRIARQLLQSAAARSVHFESAKAMLDSDSAAPVFDLIDTPKDLHKSTERLLRASRTLDITAHLNDLGVVTDLIANRNSPGNEEVERIRVLTDATPDELLGLSWSEGVEVRHLDRVPSRVALFDHHVIRSYAVDPEEDSAFTHRGNLSVRTNLLGAMEDARAHFEGLWTGGDPVEIPEESRVAAKGHTERTAERVVSLRK